MKWCGRDYNFPGFDWQTEAAKTLRWAVPAVLLAAFAMLYLLTLDDGLRPGELEGGDLITHQYAQVQGRFSNAPGYPLYTMGGWLWFRLTRLLFGADANPIALLSSYSTLWALVALGLLYALILEVLDGTSVLRSLSAQVACLLAALCTAFYGVTYFFWYYAVTTEQYTSSVAWTLAVFLLAFRWQRTLRDGYLLGLALLTGVALAHQVTVLLALPPLAWFVISSWGTGIGGQRSEARGQGIGASDQGVVLRGQRSEIRGQRSEIRDQGSGGGDQRSAISYSPSAIRHPSLALLLAAVILVLLPLASYAYVYSAGARHPEWRGVGEWADTWHWFWSFVSTGQGRAELTWSLSPFLTEEFPSLIWGELTVPGLIVGLAGVATLGRRRAVAVYGTLVLYLVFCWVDRLGNWYQVIMPAYALVVVGLAAAVGWGWQAVTGLRWHRPARWAMVLVLLLLVGYRAGLSLPRADSRGRPDDTGLQPAWAILADEPPSAAAVLGTQPEALALDYVTTIWGRRPDLRPVTSDQARALLAMGHPVLATEAALPLVSAEIGSEVRYSAIGRTLVALSLAPHRLPPSRLSEWRIDFGGELLLIGGRIDRNPVTGEAVVLLAWEALRHPSQDWSVSVRLRQGSQETAQLDRLHPVAGAYPTSRWLPGEVVGDAYPFALPPGVNPDGLTIIVYRRTADGGFQNLDVAQVAF